MRSSTLVFLLGILACQQLNHLPDSRLALLIFPLLPAAVLYPRLRLIIFFLVGLLWTVWRANLILTPQLLPKIENQPVQVIGTIVNIPLKTNYGWSFEFIPSQLIYQGLSKPLPGKLQLSWFGTPPQPLSPEQEWQLQVRLKKVHPMLNPGVFDYSSLLFSRGIRATGSVQSKSTELRLLNNNNPSSFQNIIDHWRYQLIKRIRDLLGDNPNTAIIIALAVGHQADITPQQWKTMKHAGIVHLVSVSGLHISLVAMLIFGIARRFWSYLGPAALWLPVNYFALFVSVFAATGYALLAGFSVPTQRSLVMIIVIMIGTFLARTLTGSRILALALLAVLIYDPLAVMSIGFWLSFGAIATMMYALSGRRPLFESWLIRWGINTATTQWAVTLGLFPALLAWSGNGFLLITSLLANTVAIPWFSLLTVLVLIGTSLIFVLPELSHFLLQISVYLLDAIWVFPTWLASIQWPLWLQVFPPWWATGAAIIGVAILLSPFSWHFLPKWLGLLWCLPLFFFPRKFPPLGEAWFTLLDVGQGLAAVIRTEKHVLVYDTGPQRNTAVVPFLCQQNLLAIDTLMISHEDADHSKGTTTILQELTVKELLTSAPAKFSSEYHNVRECRAGQQWQWDDVNFQMLSPTGDFVFKSNHRSCVLKVSTAGSSLLLTSDIEKLTEYRLIHDYPQQLRADILVVPHHGSKTSSAESFIDTVKPKIALFSTGYLNRFKHPAAKVVQRYQQHHIILWDTVNQGAITYHLTTTGLSPPRFARVDMRRYWHDN